MKVIAYFVAALAVSYCSHAQRATAAFLELGGSGVAISVNFDSRFKATQDGFGYRLGIGILPAITSPDGGILTPSTPAILTVPVAVNHLWGKAPNYFESGLGVTFLHTSGSAKSDFWGYDEDISGSDVIFIPSVGYRHARATNGFLWRVCISPIIGNGFHFLAGIAAGYKF